MNWDEYFLGIAKAISVKSKDKDKQVGSVIVTSDYLPVSFGYNGYIRKANEDILPRKYKFDLTVHSEMNAILFSRQSLDGCYIYTTLSPCENCLKHIIQSGIVKIIYAELHNFKPESKEKIELILRSDYNSVMCYNGITEKLFIEELL